MDDDDDFLYGGPSNADTGAAQADTRQPEPSNAAASLSPNGDDEEEDMDEEDSEDDIEIITDAPVQPAGAASIDLRPRPAPPVRPPVPASTLTTEYKPLQRDDSVKKALPPPASQPPIPAPTPSVNPALATASLQLSEPNEPQVDPKSLPHVTAPASAPKIELDKDGLLDGRSVYEVDIASLENKAWRRPGADLSDWFNYGFDEISWEAYAARRRDLGEMAPILKANVLAFSSMSEEQVLNMPGDLRGMVMQSAHMASMNASNPAMLQPQPGVMPPEMMMNMGMMNQMGPGPMVPPNIQQGGGDMNPGQQQMMMPNMLPGNDSDTSMAGPGMMGGGGMGGFGGDMTGGGMVDFSEGGSSGGQFGVDTTGVGAQATPPTGPGGARGAAAFRGRGAVPPPTVPKGRGVPPAAALRGRGRGFDVAPPTGPRAASPLPPNVPTGPRNQHRYKDRDTGGPSGENLDYGGDFAGGGRSDKPLRDEFGRDIERGSRDREREDDRDSKSSRKRRASPPEDSRGSKRR